MTDTNLPLLVFPRPTEAERTRQRGWPRNPKLPPSHRQATRLMPHFQRLKEVMESHRIALQDNPLGIIPEQALVLETVGTIDNFFKAVKKVDGLEWLGEYEVGDLAPDHGFEEVGQPDRPLKGHLFLVMTDQQALKELERLFQIWKESPEETLPRGFAPLKHVFEQLYAIRPWGPEDRIRETGILEDWQDRLENGQEIVPFEIELWFRANASRRQQSEALIRATVNHMDGDVIRQCIIPEIQYHAVLGRMPIQGIHKVISDPTLASTVALFRIEAIVWLRPVGQCTGGPVPRADTNAIKVDRAPNLRQDNPIVALLDGLPMTGHRLLAGRLIVDDPDGYENDYQAVERVHGTAMASLICHGDWVGDDSQDSRMVYVRPMMKPRRSFRGQFNETIPEDELPVDLIHRTIRRLFEQDGDGTPVAPSVRIVSLSIGDSARPLDREMSAWARLLDWLAWKYQILFVVSAGNHTQDLELELPRSKLSGLTVDAVRALVVRAVVADARNRRLLSPAETINGLTIGALHEDRSVQMQGISFDPFLGMAVPSIISSQGLGFRRSIKPDVLFPGGRQMLEEKFAGAHDKTRLSVTRSSAPPGQCVATPGDSGQRNRTVHSRGTSNAAALASRSAGLLYEVVEELRTQSDPPVIEKYDVVLVKALLVHSADWTHHLESYRSILAKSQGGGISKEFVGRFLGYGSVDIRRVVACTEERVTVLGFGDLNDGEAAEFKFPLPPSLSTKNLYRRLTITLAWLSPVNNRHRNYRVAQLWFDPRNDFAGDRRCADHNAVRRGTVQHEILEGTAAHAYEDGESLTIRVNCRADAGDIVRAVQFGLAVTLEVAEGEKIPIYNEVRDRLRVRIEAPTRLR